MKESWFAGVTSPEQREKVKNEIALAHNAFRKLERMLKSRLATPKVSDYQKSAWPYWRADMDGYNRAIQEVLELIKEED